MNSTKKKFAEWKIDLDLLCREKLGLGLEDIPQHQVSQEELRDYWSDGSSPREFIEEIITSTDHRETTDVDPFDIKYEI